MQKRQRLLALSGVAATALAVVAAGALAGDNTSGFRTSQASMLTTGDRSDVTFTPIATTGDLLPGGTRFASIPDGIALRTRGQGRVDVYVNHETSTVPFPYNPTAPTESNSQNDFDNAEVSLLALNQHSAGVLTSRKVITSAEGFQRFCSNFLAWTEQGFDRGILFTNEEAVDWVNRSGKAWPAVIGSPGARQAGLVVAHDIKSGDTRPIYGMGRHNHENTVAIPGYGHPVLLTGDDTFSAPSSQLYLYSAASADAVWNDAGTLYGFVSDDPAVNDYGDLSGSESVSGHFLEVPHAIAVGDQTGLENWSNANNVFQFIRVEDLAYDRNDHNVIYFADTGEPRAIPSTTSDRLVRGPAGTQGSYMNGRVFRLELDPSDPLDVASLSILIDGDAGGYNNPDALHQPDNLETTATSLLIQEDEGGHNASFAGAQNNRVWQYSFATGEMRVVAEVDQALDPAASTGSWESTGIVDASAYFGPGAFLVNIQAHSIFVETAPLPGYPNVTQKEEGGQMLILRIPDA